ncbi:PIN-like domain-containing protein [Salinimicrobium sp. TH3]|uniref:PIN-like domain-containing protein n=1 Tax=Salinimicrobium sp. TH3 TaxID=2997342 RepID=UPI002276692C|nr:PIN domain-containing protein [Salinimicrobium sp. TH3]MCY2686489.1 PIN domain-containing protein [Salinimicrobium sp. TH3]
MKEIFPGYYKKSEAEIKNIWDSCIICFDANVLLNLYRYSERTRTILLDLIGKFDERIWLPHQSALEYNKNRYEVIIDQEKAYKDFISRIEKIKSDLQSNSKPPFLSDDLHKSLNKVFEKVDSEVNSSIKSYQSFLKDDPVYESISRLFKDKISGQYDQKQLKEIFSQGEVRFENKIPPGYEDAKDKKGVEKFGDLIIWNQIIDKAKKEKRNIIFITDERKGDWWWKLKDGRKTGPRQELTEEIYNIAKVEFHMYSSERFLSYGQQYLSENINKEAVEEIKEMKRSDMEKIIRLKRLRENQAKHLSKNYLDENDVNQKTFHNKQKFLRYKWLRLMDQISKTESLKEEAQNDPNQKLEYIQGLEGHLLNLREEQSRIEEEIENNMFYFNEKKKKWFLRLNNEEKDDGADNE